MVESPNAASTASLNRPSDAATAAEPVKRPARVTTPQSAYASTGSTEPPAKRFKPDYSDTVTIRVGPTEHDFTVHKATICRYSPFFTAACSQRSVKGKATVVRLPEADSRVFGVYVHWTYTEKVDMVFLWDASDDDARVPVLHLGEVWILANYLQDTRLCNRVCDMIIQRYQQKHSWLHPKPLQGIWEHTVLDSPLRRLVTDLTAAYVTPQDIIMFGQQYPTEIIIHLATKFASGETRKAAFSQQDRCKYHIHESGAEKCL